ncbi:MAG: flagellar filament capping protein FliD, partial [Proteobacteria bacterium]|nr:flagellar filament capping protein FliD [Pseudomonadota bacterium]
LSSGEASTGTLTIGGSAVTINLSSMSLNDIKDAINDESIAGVTASVISQTVDQTTYYRLQIDGTQTFFDEKNILNTLGIQDHTSVDVTGKVSANSLTQDGTYITATTLLKNIDGYNTFTAGGNPDGDFITLTGTNTSNVDIGSVNFNIASSTTVQDLLDEIETRYGDVVAYVTSDGKIKVDDLTGGSYLVVSPAATIHDASSQLDFGAFGAAAARKREVVAGEDATVEIDGVTVAQSTNVIDDVISGVTLNLVSEDDDTTVTLNIKRDLDAVKSKFQTLVNNYNQVLTYINTQFTYDSESEEAGGILFGDSTLRSVKADFTAILSETVWGLDSNFSALGLIGIDNKVDENNKLQLSIDTAVLTGYLQTNFNDVAALFTGQGTASHSSVNFIGHSRDTQAGEYDVHINRAATRGTETGNVNLAAGGAAETLTITQGASTAEITITSGMDLDDIVNEINTELDTAYIQTLVGDEQLYADSGTTGAITSETAWNSIYDSLGAQLSFANGNTISFSGTSHNGNDVSGSYQISNVASDTVQGLLSAIENAFASKVSASIDTSGRIVVTDQYEGTGQLAVSSISHSAEGEFFGTVDVTAGAGDGSQNGRYAMAITATDDGSNHLVLRSDVYGSTGFTVSQDTSDNQYYYMLYSDTGNTTDSTVGTVFIENTTSWSDVYGAGVTTSEEIEISGTARNGAAISRTHTINTANTLETLLQDIETAYSAQGTTVNAFIRNGRIYVEDTTAASAGATPITLTLTYTGSGSLDLGLVDQTTERDLDLGLINGTVSGLDVAGTLDGESATGSGQLLRGDDGNTNTDGLAVSYTGSSNDIDAGTIKLTLGVAELFSRALFSITDPFEGYVAFKQDSLQDSISSYDDQIEQMEARLDRRMEMLINKFVAMELALSRMQNQSNWLASQIDALFM